MNKKILAVVKREYVIRAKTKGFIIGTLLFPVIIIFVFGGIFIIGKFFQPSTKHYNIIDQTGRIYNELVDMLPDTLKNGEPKYQFVETKATPEEIDEVIEILQSDIRKKKIEGYLFIPEDVIESREVRYSALNVSDFEELSQLERTLSRIVGNIRLENRGFSPEEIRKEMSLGWISLVSHQVTEKGEVSKHGTSNFLLTYILTYMLLLLMMIYGQTVMRSVIEEKTQRITETIISSIRPVELMLGKLAGICLLGITQILVIGFFIYMVAAYGEPIFIKFGVTVPKLLQIVRNLSFSPVVFLFMIIYFFMGYIFYSSIYAAVGAMVNTEDEGQQFQTPIIILIILSFFIMISVARNPDTVAAFWASLIPFFTPIVMFARIAVSDPIIPSGAYLSLFTMGISIVLLIMFVAKIYRTGILMYGKKPSIKEVIKWIKYK